LTLSGFGRIHYLKFERCPDCHFVAPLVKGKPEAEEFEIGNLKGAITFAGPKVIMKSLQKPAYARRLSSRVNTGDEVWVYWRCHGRDDVSRVRDLCTKGLFLETEEPRTVGATVKLDFLVQEGQIRADAAVQHAKSGEGLGLKFMAVTPEDGTHLAALLTRLREVGSIPLKPVIKELTVLENAAQSPFSSTEV